MNLTPLRCRDYEAGVGRYVESDPIGLKGGVITYAYGKNSPMRYIDSAGLKPSDSYCKANPLGCGVAYHCGGLALTIAGGGQNDLSHALRHCLWSCCMAVYLGESAAKGFGDDNETIPNNRDDSKNMDLCNNAQGRGCRGKLFVYATGCVGCCKAAPLVTLSQ